MNISDEDLSERVHSCMDRCVSYGLTTEEQILQFAQTSLLLGEHFDSDPENEWVSEVLTDPETTPDERAAMLLAVAEMLIAEQEGD